MIYFCTECRIKLEKKPDRKYPFYWCPNCGRCYFREDLKALKVQKIFLTENPQKGCEFKFNP